MMAAFAALISLIVSAAQKLCKKAPHIKYSLSLAIPNPGQEAMSTAEKLAFSGSRCFLLIRSLHC
jgi:hypothetical protein